jgi:hypothetical protein
LLTSTWRKEKNKIFLVAKFGEKVRREGIGKEEREKGKASGSKRKSPLVVVSDKPKTKKLESERL